MSTSYFQVPTRDIGKILGIILLILNIWHMVATAALRSQIADVSHAYDQTGQPRKLPIKVRSAVMKFSDDPFLDIHAAGQWKALIPKGNGWVLLDFNKTAYAVSMYHQLHCLNGIRHDLIFSRAGKEPNQARLSHAHHCYNYLRQGLLCKADVTLEPTNQILFDDGRIGAAASGNGVEHICKDWVQIRQYMEKNFRDNANYIFWN